jgi:hypothetical protein
MFHPRRYLAEQPKKAKKRRQRNNDR